MSSNGRGFSSSFDDLLSTPNTNKISKSHSHTNLKHPGLSSSPSSPKVTKEPLEKYLSNDSQISTDTIYQQRPYNAVTADIRSPPNSKAKRNSQPIIQPIGKNPGLQRERYTDNPAQLRSHPRARKINSQPLPQTPTPGPQPVTQEKRYTELQSHKEVTKIYSQPLPPPPSYTQSFSQSHDGNYTKNFLEKLADVNSIVNDKHKTEETLKEVATCSTTSSSTDLPAPIPWKCSCCKINYGESKMGCPHCGELAPYFSIDGVCVQSMKPKKPFNRKSICMHTKIYWQSSLSGSSYL